MIYFRLKPFAPGCYTFDLFAPWQAEPGDAEAARGQIALTVYTNALG